MRKLENSLKVVVPTFYTGTKNGVSQTNFLHRTHVK